MSRLPEISRESFEDAKQVAFDALVEDNGGSVPMGPGLVAAHSPVMALSRRALSHYVRYEIPLPQSVQELAILVTARRGDCPYVWNAHAPEARKQGVNESLVSAIRDGGLLPPMNPEEAAVVNLTNELLETHQLSDSTFSAASDAFGLAGVIDVIMLIGQYQTNTNLLNALEIQLPETSEPLLPIQR